MQKVIYYIIFIFLTASSFSSEKGKIVSTGPDFKEISKVHKILLNFRDKYALPGVSIAISQKERLVYAAACGWADFENQVKLTTDHKMRIFSLSKPITAITIMMLIEKKQLKLSDQVFGSKGILGEDYGMPRYKGETIALTIQNLLEHTSGGWSNSSNDPMFRYLDLNGADLIKKVLKFYPLNVKPGVKYDYSNFGYYLLGRVIEKITGKSYEEYVKEEVLAKCGITEMRIGKDFSENDESKYFPTTYYDYDNPYLYSPLHMDAHGGWVANPQDLLKLLVRIDNFSQVPDILTKQSIYTMTKPSARNAYYALGWFVNPQGNWWHTGSLAGGSSIMVRASNGFNWVVMVNYRKPFNDNKFQEDLDLLTWQIIETIKEWPEGFEL